MPQKLLQLWRSGEMASRYQNLIKIVQGPNDLLLFNYTDECQNKKLWDDVTLLCRGVILHAKTGEVVARPFEKFFNWHEYQGEIPKEPFSVAEKVDGSLGILYRNEGQHFLATRGSFTSPEAKRGTELLRKSLNGASLPEEVTFLFEIILGDNGNTVVKYDFEGLFLLGALNRFTGAELPQDELDTWANRFGWRLPKRYPFASTEEVLATRSTLPADMEGYVLRFQSGLRLKLKSDAYLAVLRASLGLSKGKVISTLLQGEAQYKALLEESPEELRPFAERVAQEARALAKKVEEEAKRVFEQAPKGSRKDFALWVQQNAPQNLRGPLFMMLDNKEPRWLEWLGEAV